MSPEKLSTDAAQQRHAERVNTERAIKDSTGISTQEARERLRERATEAMREERIRTPIEPEPDKRPAAKVESETTTLGGSPLTSTTAARSDSGGPVAPPVDLSQTAIVCVHIDGVRYLRTVVVVGDAEIVD